jgi:hypothetical protein
MAVLSRALAETLWPEPIGRIGALAWFGQTFLVCAALESLHAVASRGLSPAGPPVAARAGGETVAQQRSEPDAGPAGDFRARLTADAGRDVLALQMEDHYVRVHFEAGSTLVLIPLHQAIAELGAIPGLRVHRSWWVARHAVIGALRDGRNRRLCLINGLQVPVARASVATVRAAGLLDAVAPPSRAVSAADISEA